MLMVYGGLCNSILDVQYYEDLLDFSNSNFEKSYFLHSRELFGIRNIEVSIKYVLHHISKVKQGFQWLSGLLNDIR